MRKIVLSGLISLLISFPAYAEKKIAVLPFSTPNTKDDIKQFSFGTMASITHALSSMDEYVVIDRGQIDNIIKELGFQKTGLIEKDQIKIGKLSGVDILVLGTIQKSNDNYRINVNFTDVQTGKIIKTFQVTGAEIFDLQDKLSSEILKETGLTSKDIIKTNNANSYNNFVSAVSMSKNYDKKSLEQSLKLLNQSIKNDQSYIQAYDARAKVNAMLSLIIKGEGGSYLDKFSDAELDAEKVIEEGGKNVNPFLALYITGLVEGKKGELNGIFAKAVKVNSSETADAMFNLANFYKSKNDTDKEEFFYKKSIEADPQYQLSYLSLGHLYQDQDKYENAINIYKKGLITNPKFDVLRLNLGSIYLVQGDYDLSEKEYRESIAIDPDSWLSHLALATILEIKDNKKEALEEYNKAISINDKSDNLYSSLGNLYLKLNDLEKAYNNFKKSLAINSGSTMAMRGMAEYYSAKGDNKKAFEILKSAMTKNDFKNTVIISALSGLYLKNKMYNELITDMTSYLTKNKEYGAGYMVMAQAYQKLNKYDMAISNYKIALNKKISNKDKELVSKQLKDIYLFYGIEKYKSGSYEEAIETYNKAIEISEDVSTYNNIGVAYYMLKNYDKAIEQYQKALKINSNHLDSIINMAMTYEALGKKSDADNQYRKACSLGYKEKCNF